MQDYSDSSGGGGLGGGALRQRKIVRRHWISSIPSASINQEVRNRMRWEGDRK